jgi:hypothetical protein
VDVALTLLIITDMGPRREGRSLPYGGQCGGEGHPVLQHGGCRRAKFSLGLWLTAWPQALVLYLLRRQLALLEAGQSPLAEHL